MRRTWSKAATNKLKRLYKNLPTEQVAKQLGKPLAAVKSKAAVLRLRKRKTYRWQKFKPTAVSEQTKQWVIRNFQKHTIKELARLVGCSISSVYAIGRSKKLRKATNSGCFKKGVRAWNTGTKGVMKSTAAMRRTQFKKGQASANSLPDGTITVRKDKRGVSYQFIRLAAGVWEPLHVHNAKKKWGPLAAGSVVRFRDGNTLDPRPANLEVISKAENVRRNYNKKKAVQALKELSDNYIAGRLASGDKTLRALLIATRQDLIVAKRTQLLLRREIKSVTTI